MRPSAYRCMKFSRSAFTLVELVVVVLIVGILAAVAAPKMFDTSSRARESATKASLSVVRNAIEMYYSETGSYPEAGSIQDQLKPFVKGPFPQTQVGKKNNRVQAGTSPTGDAGWLYDNGTGNFWVNDSAYLEW